ncbi:MAG: carbohydrate-binding domain-containing protein [Bdellovibrionota bacterium]
MTKFSTIFAAAFLSVLSFACGSGSDQTSSVKAISGGGGISTEHGINGVGKTACSFKKEDILRLQAQGYYYAAVAPSNFANGANCGKIIEVAVGGACYENHNTNCKNTSGHASLAQYAAASGQKAPNNRVRLFVADLCGSCVNDNNTPHLDIVDESMKGNGPIAALRSYFERNVQRVKQAGTNRTAQPNNLFLSSVQWGGCVPGLKFESWVASGPCKNGGSANPAPPSSGSAWKDPYSGATFPYCSSSSKSTGNGWGWENNRSCKVR